MRELLSAVAVGFTYRAVQLLCYKSGGVSTRRALTYLGSHLGARESRPNRLAAAAAGVAGLQAGLWPALGKLWRGAGEQPPCDFWVKIVPIS